METYHSQKSPAVQILAALCIVLALGTGAFAYLAWQNKQEAETATQEQADLENQLEALRTKISTQPTSPTTSTTPSPSTTPDPTSSWKSQTFSNTVTLRYPSDWYFDSSTNQIIKDINTPDGENYYPVYISVIDYSGTAAEYLAADKKTDDATRASGGPAKVYGTTSTISLGSNTWLKTPMQVMAEKFDQYLLKTSSGKLISIRITTQRGEGPVFDASPYIVIGEQIVSTALIQ